jgi:S-layer family protein
MAVGVRERGAELVRTGLVRWLGIGLAVVALCSRGLAAPSEGEGEPGHTHAAPSDTPGRASHATEVTPQQARQAAQKLAQKRIMAAPDARFRPDQPVTRGELAIVLVRMIDYLESQGPKKASLSKSPPLVTPRVRAGLSALPRRHPAYAAIRRLALGGYLLASGGGDLFMPTAKNINRPVTAEELSAALAGIASRIAEKRVVLEHPEVLEQQRDTVTAPGQHRGLNTPAP